MPNVLAGLSEQRTNLLRKRSFDVSPHLPDMTTGCLEAQHPPCDREDANSTLRTVDEHRLRNLGLWCHHSAPHLVARESWEAAPEDHCGSPNKSSPHLHLHSQAQTDNHEQTGLTGNSARNTHAVITTSACWPFTRDSPPRLHVAAATSPEGHSLGPKPRGIKVCLSLGHPTEIPINRDEKCWSSLPQLGLSPELRAGARGDLI